MQQKVKLRTSHGTSITSRKNAERYVKRGLARAVSAGVFELIENETDYRQISVSAAKRRLCFDDGLATLQGLANTPVVNPIRLLTGRRGAVAPREDRVVVLSVQRADRSVSVYAVPMDQSNPKRGQRVYA